MDGLKNICSEYLSANLTLENAVEIMVASYLTDQKTLLDASFKFVWENNRNAYLKDDFSANDDNTYKILPFTLPPYKGEI